MKVIVYGNKGEAENKINVDIPELRFCVGDLGLTLRKFITKSVSPGGRYQQWVSIEIDGRGEIWHLLGYWELIANGLEEIPDKSEENNST